MKQFIADVFLLRECFKRERERRGGRDASAAENVACKRNNATHKMNKRCCWTFSPFYCLRQQCWKRCLKAEYATQKKLHGKLRRNGRGERRRKQKTAHFVLHKETEESAFLKRHSKAGHILASQIKPCNSTFIAGATLEPEANKQTKRNIWC